MHFANLGFFLCVLKSVTRGLLVEASLGVMLCILFHYMCNLKAKPNLRQRDIVIKQICALFCPCVSFQSLENPAFAYFPVCDQVLLMQSAESQQHKHRCPGRTGNIMYKVLLMTSLPWQSKTVPLTTERDYLGLILATHGRHIH